MIRDQDVHELSLQRAADCIQFRGAAGDPHDVRDRAEVLQCKPHDPVVQVRGDGLPARVEVAQVDVAHCAAPLQLLQLVPRHDAALPHEDGILAGGADADEGDVRPARRVQDTGDVCIAEERIPGRAVSRNAGGGKGHGTAAQEVRQPSGQLRGVGVPAGVHDAAQPLDHQDAVQLAMGVAPQAIHHCKERSSPAEHDPVLRTDHPQQVVGSADPGFARHRGLVIVGGGFDDHGLFQAVAFLKGLLPLGVHAQERLHDDTDDAFLLGRIQQALDLLPGQAHALGDARLRELRLVVQPGDFHQEAVLVEVRPGGLRRSEQMPNIVHMPQSTTGLPCCQFFFRGELTPPRGCVTMGKEGYLGICSREGGE